MHKYEEIEKYFYQQIESGQLKPGDKLDSEQELALAFHVSRPTVRQALNGLAQDGYLVRKKKKGTFVSQPVELHKSTSFIASYRNEAAEQGHEVITKVLDLSKVSPDEDVIEALSLPKKAKVFRLTRLRWIKRPVKTKPVMYTIVYISERFSNMMDIDFTNTSLYEKMDQNGLHVVHVSRQIEIVSPDDEVCRQLEISPWEPCFFIKSRGFLADGTVIEYAITWYPATTSKFLVELQR